MDFKLETEFSKADIFKEVDALKKQVDGARPLPKDVEDRVMQKLRLEWNYNSNAIEGNKLNYGETTALLMHGITAKGKPLKDHLDIQGHNDAINFLLSIIKEDRPFTEADIRQLHEITLVESYIVTAQTDDGKSTTKQIKLGAYKTSPNHVKTITGETHYYASPEDTPAKMQELMEWYNEIIKDKSVHPIIVAALFHHRFTEIHPFDDGNGRVARLLMNLILMRDGYPPVVIKMDDRQNYYSLLSRADVGELFPFIEYIVEQLQSSLRIYVKGINGEDIDEDEDIDKEIALFKVELQNQVQLKEKRSNRLIEEILKSQIEALINKIENKTKQFEDLFFEKSYSIEFDGNDFASFSHSTLNNFFIQGTVYKERILNQTKSVVIRFSLIKFKSLNNDFSIANWIKIDFEEYRYSFFDTDNSLILSKLYHENLTTNDVQKIIKTLVEDLKSNISKEIKSPKSN